MTDPLHDIDLKTEISAVVALRWDAFAAEHPRLARVVDQHLLVESAARALNLDMDYQRSITNARAVNAGQEVMLKLIDRYVSKFIATLI
ncbi:MAG TPA: hypothetical protein VF624_17860 [Tepidisphaeraceae bacterium]|jgi:hypothetical protein